MGGQLAVSSRRPLSTRIPLLGGGLLRSRDTLADPRLHEQAKAQRLSDHDHLLDTPGLLPQRWDPARCMGLGCPASQRWAHYCRIDRGREGSTSSHHCVSHLVLRTRHPCSDVDADPKPTRGPRVAVSTIAPTAIFGDLGGERELGIQEWGNARRPGCCYPRSGQSPCASKPPPQSSPDVDDARNGVAVHLLNLKSAETGPWPWPNG